MRAILPSLALVFLASSLSAAPAPRAAPRPAPAPAAAHYTPPNNPAWPAGTPIGPHWPAEHDLVRFPPRWLAEQRLALFEGRVRELRGLLDGGLLHPDYHGDVEELLCLARRQAAAWEHLVLAHRAAALRDPKLRHYGVRYHLDDLRLHLNDYDYGRGLLPDVPLP
jgi:hypothetical protein